MNIRNHEIIHEISRGAITTVYKAKHLNLNRTVLLKVLNKQWLKEDDLLKRFKREAQISAHLQHPNIVNVYDFEISTKLVFISLEFVDGQTLGGLLKNATSLSIDKTASILKDCLKALDYAHRKGVIHRDLKPDNILLDKNLKASITDFGLSSFNDIPSITEQGQSMGTPAYMAPEQIQGKAGNEQSDLYSLGITLYEMLSNTSPFLKENTAATLQGVLADNLKDVNTFRNDIPQWLTSLTNELTNKTPELRPKDAAFILDKYFNEKADSLQETKLTLNKKTISFFIVAITILIFFVSYFSSNNIEKKADKPVSKSITKPDSVLEIKKDLTEKNIEKKDNTAAKIESVYTPKEETDKNPTLVIETNEPIEAIEKYGSFFVVCTPWANILLNGDSIDTTPMKEAIRVKTGKHLIKLINPNYRTQIHEIEIRNEISDTLNVRLDPNFGYVMVKASPWAKIYLNGKYTEETPLNSALIIPTGQNILKLINPNFKTITDTIFVEAGKSIEKHYNFLN